VDRDRKGGSTLMAPDDGEWIRDETASPAGAREHSSQPAGDAGRPGQEWPDEDWPDDESPDDEWPGDESPADDWPPDPPDPPPETGKRWGHGGVPGFSVRAAAAVAVLAAAAGVAVGLLLVRGTPAASPAGPATPGASAPGATAPGGTTPGGTTAPGGGGTNLPALPGPGGNGNGQMRIILTGRVLAVSATSITIGGNGPSVTAAVTGATKITGKARGIAGVKAGDQVAAQVGGTPGHLTAIAIRDPAGTLS
jgi:hypothetical protein